MQNYNNDELACKLVFTNGRSEMVIPLCGDLTGLSPQMAAMALDSQVQNPLCAFTDALEAGAFSELPAEAIDAQAVELSYQSERLFNHEESCSLLELGIRAALAFTNGDCVLVKPKSELDEIAEMLSYDCSCDCGLCEGCTVCDGSCIEDDDCRLTVPEYLDFAKEAAIGQEWF